MNNIDHLKQISLDGGLLCLDFINTVSDYYAEEPINYITNADEWLTWLKRVKEIENDFERFDPGTFNIRDILEARKTLYQLFHHYVNGEIIPVDVVAKFNKYCSRMYKYLKFVAHGKDITEILDYNKHSAIHYLLPIIRSAKETITSGQLKNIKECPNCGWIFLDNTKSNTRRWCNMKACGNKIKTRRYYLKTSAKTEKH